MKKSTIILLVAALILIIALPMVFLGRSAQFGGSDGEAEALITELDPDYEPWFTPLMDKIFPDGLPGELESLLFCLQAALGSGVVCFGIGYMAARAKYRKKEPDQDERH